MESRDNFEADSLGEVEIDNSAQKIEKMRKSFIERYEMTPDRKKKITTMFEHISNFLASGRPNLLDARTDAFQDYRKKQLMLLQKLQVQGVAAELQPFSISEFLNLANHPLFGDEGKDRFMNAWLSHTIPPCYDDLYIEGLYHVGGWSPEEIDRQTAIYKEFEYLSKLKREVLDRLYKRMEDIFAVRHCENKALSELYNPMNGSIKNAVDNIGFSLVHATLEDTPEVLLDSSLAIVDLLTTGPFPPLQGWPIKIKNKDGINRYYALTK
jgi:hypothetical protein